MTEAREAILTAIRHAVDLRRSASLGAPSQTPPEGNRGEAAAPAQPAVDGDCIGQFMRRITVVGASLARLESWTEIPAAVRAFLDAHGFSHRLVCSRERLFEALVWPEDFALSVGAATDGDHTALTGVVAAVAETGSLVVASAPHTPNTLHFLPENHIAVVRAPQVVRHLEDVWPLMRQRPGGMPRALTFISGPSRTADVEQTIQIGAHGPRRLHVVLING